jgi:acyl-[acyl-carrier-protein] desaturase
MMTEEAAERELLIALEAVVSRELPLLKPVAESWQPSDILPEMESEGWHERIQSLREGAATLSDNVLVVLAGNIVTEEALPSYQTWLNRVHGLSDTSGTSDSPWGLWSRGWTAEEKRHGDVLSKYLYLSGRVDMHSVEVTVQHLIRNGFDIRSDNDPFSSLVYASFQERATKISHANTGKLAEKCGDKLLAKMCSLIAGDEARHGEAYKRFFAGAIALDAPRSVIAFARMMRQKVAMPARLMSDGTDRDLFNQFAVVAQKSGVYTTRDYADVMDYLVDVWEIASLRGLTGEAAEAQEYLCNLGQFYRGKAERIEEILSRTQPEPFAWIHDRCV